MNLRDKTVKGAKWSAISTVIIIGLGFLQMVFLSRMLDRNELGLLTIAMVIIVLADTVSDFGISNSIIQKKNITNMQLATLYWLNVAIGLFVCVISFSLSTTIASFLRTPDLKELIVVISIAFIIIPHGQQFRALMQKEMDFSTIGKIETFSCFLGFTLTLILAYVYPHAIVAMFGYLANAISRTILFAYTGHKLYSPSLNFSIKSVKSNIRFGAYLTADSLLNFVNTNISTAILARTLGTIVTGGYNLAYNVAVVPPTKLNPIITRVLFPAFSKIQDDESKLKITFYKLLSLVGIVNFPLLLGLMVVSENFVLFVFGEQWVFITPMLQVLCLVGLLRSIGNPIGSLLMAKARVDISFKFNLFKIMLFIPGIIIGVKLGGGFGAALAFLVVQLMNTVLSYFILIKPVLGESYKEYLHSIWLPLKLSIPTVIISWLLGYIIPGTIPNIITLGLQISFGAISFLITIYFSQSALINEVKMQLFKSVKLRNIFRVKL
ncbi:MOP flippase family protein [Serratia fonticola]|uniref:MOP flippase family protein n=1 Tax=Serratia fonticola TaxID=47917 RepID=UPI0015773673|nr:MOP flippase family protein [Serratia fonticola]NTY86849.1 MOP flippase family protein [Serratia fonticola]NTZ12816.1 MOP flippase family protein [Serratia fonticola]